MSLAVLTALRDRVERQFVAAGLEHARFADIATRALQEAELHRAYRFDFDELTQWMLAPDHVVPMGGRRQFSDLPVTVARGTGFYVEILVWAVGTAAIHQHAFSGAFTVLAGSSIHSHYRLETLDRISEGMRI